MPIYRDIELAGLLDEPLRILPFSARVKRLLFPKMEQIYGRQLLTVSDLVSMRANWILAVKGIGPVALADIRDILASLDGGLHLDMPNVEIRTFGNVQLSNVGRGVKIIPMVTHTDPDILGTPLSTLGFTTRTRNCLIECIGHADGTIRDLLALYEGILLRLPKFGRKSLNEVREVLAARGLWMRRCGSDLQHGAMPDPGDYYGA